LIFGTGRATDGDGKVFSRLNGGFALLEAAIYGKIALLDTGTNG
jgi:hypothetical protein